MRNKCEPTRNAKVFTRVVNTYWRKQQIRFIKRALKLTFIASVPVNKVKLKLAIRGADGGEREGSGRIILN